jgi:hypothetical protein
VSNLELALLIKPFVALVLFGLICLPIRFAVKRWLRDGKLKRLLLFRIRE